MLGHGPKTVGQTFSRQALLGRGEPRLLLCGQNLLGSPAGGLRRKAQRCSIH